MSHTHTHTHSNSEGEWDVPRLWRLAAGLPVVVVDPKSFPEWGSYSWERDLTLGGLVEHMRRVLEADLTYPIIVSAEGYVMDGCHRLARAGLEGVPVRMVRFKVTPPADRPTIKQ